MSSPVFHFQTMGGDVGVRLSTQRSHVVVVVVVVVLT